MEESILISVKKMLSINEDCTDFDTDIIININTVMSMLNQMGVGPEEGFIVTSSTETWSELLNNVFVLNMVKTYMFLKIKLIFDPPLSASVLGSTERLITELEYRITASARTDST